MRLRRWPLMLLLWVFLAFSGIHREVAAAPVTYDVTWGEVFFGQLPIGSLTVDDSDPGFGASEVPLLDWSLEHPAGVWNTDDTVLFGTPTLSFDDVSGAPVGFTLYSIDDTAPLGNYGLIFQFSLLDGIFAIVDGSGHFLAKGRDPQFLLSPSPVPLPAAFPLLLTGLAGFGVLRWLRNRWVSRQA